MNDCITGSAHTRAIIDAEQIRIQQLGVHMGLRGQSTLQLHRGPRSRNDRDLLRNEFAHMGPPQWDMFFACFDLGHRLYNTRVSLSSRYFMDMVLIGMNTAPNGEHCALISIQNKPHLERTLNHMRQHTHNMLEANRISMKYGIALGIIEQEAAAPDEEGMIGVSISITSVLRARRDGKF